MPVRDGDAVAVPVGDRECDAVPVGVRVLDAEPVRVGDGVIVGVAECERVRVL